MNGRIMQTGDIVEVIVIKTLRFAALKEDVQKMYAAAFEERLYTNPHVGKRGLITETYTSPTGFYALVDFSLSGHRPPVLMRGDEISVVTTSEEIEKLVEIIEPPHAKILEDWLNKLCTR